MNNTKLQSNIQVRIDLRTKKEAQKTLDCLGLDLSSAVKLFLRSVIATQSIPFEIRTKNGFTRAQEARMIHEAEDALQNGKGYSSYKELVKDIMAEKD